MYSIKLNLQRIGNFLFYLIVFLIPTQLAYHFWPQYSFVYGLKIDYLSFAIYLTDILVFIYIILFLLINKNKGFYKKSSILNIFIFFLFIIINIFFSKQKELSIFRWIKVLEYLIFSFTVSRNLLLNNTKLYKTFCYSIILFGLIAVAQSIKGSTLGGLLYYLGERTFNSSTPGISLLNVFNLSFLKPYSTFSHPNSLAGYLLVVLIYLYFWQTHGFKDKYLKNLTCLLILLLLLLSFSKNVLFSLFIVSIILIFDFFSNLKRIYVYSFLIILASLLLPIISTFLIKNPGVFSESLSQRLLLSEMSIQMLQINPIFGLGLNNFIKSMPLLNNSKLPFWLLQPVHNIFLLVTVETGLIGIGLFFLKLFQYLKYLIENNKIIFIYILLTIFLTGFFDHYWFTLQQNILLLVLFLGLSKNPQIK